MTLPRLYGMQRSGSTLVHNVIELICGEKIIKSHQFFDDAKEAKIILTYRDFRDSAVSEWRVYEGKFDEIEMAKKVGFNDLKKYLDRKKASVGIMNSFKKKYPDDQLLFLRYENFYNNIGYLVDIVGKFLSVNVSDKKKMEILEKTNIKTKKKEAKKLVDFKNYDKNTYIHGRHIFTGEEGTWKILVVKKDWNIINEYIGKELAQWGYKV